MRIALIDNGSLEPAPHLRLRGIAAAVGERTGVRVEAVSWKHSDRIGAASLGGVPARTLAPWLRNEWADGQRDFIFIPFFISPQGAIGSALRADIERFAAAYAAAGEINFTFTGSLASSGVLPEIVADRILGALRNLGEGGSPPSLPAELWRVRPAAIIVDHGGPSPASAALRDAVAGEVRNRLGARVGPLAAASMESPGDGPGFAFNRPLLDEVLDRPGFDRGDVLIAPLFLSPGRHAAPGGDLDRIVRAAQSRHPGLRCHFTGLVGDHAVVVETLTQSLLATVAPLSTPNLS